MGHFETLFNFIYDKVSSIKCVKNKFNPTYKVLNIKNGGFQNAQWLFCKS